MKSDREASNRRGRRGPRVIGRVTPRKVIAALKERVYADVRDVVMEKELVDERRAPKNGMRVVEADRRAVRRFCRENPEVRGELTKCLSYLDNHYRGLLAVVEGKAVGHVWWCDHRLERALIHPQMVRYGIELAPGEAWSFDLFVLRQHRGGGASNEFFALFRKHLRDEGYTRVFGHVESDNLPAVWIHKVQGYRPVKTVEGRLFAGTLLWSEGRLFLRNPPLIGLRQKFDFRAIW